MKLAKPIPVQSASVGTRSARRAMRIMARTKARPVIAYAGQYVCKDIAGSNTPSQHSYGNADDLFPTPGGDQAAKRKTIFHAAIWEATHRTIANRGRKLPLMYCIDHDARLVWSPTGGVHPYGGTTGNHVHMDYVPQYSGPCGARP